VNICLKIRRRRSGEVGLSEVKTFSSLNLPFGNISSVACSDRFTVFVEERKKKVYVCGYNKNGECGLSPDAEEIILQPKLIFDLDNDIGGYQGERIVEVCSGFNFFIIRTSHRLLFFGNNEHGQFPRELGETWGLSFLRGQELNLYERVGRAVSDIKTLKCKYDRTCIIFKDGTALLFGGLLPDKTVNPFIDFKEEIDGFEISEIGLGVDYELLHGRFK